jgi:hypothetical protein
VLNDGQLDESGVCGGCKLAFFFCKMVLFLKCAEIAQTSLWGCWQTVLFWNVVGGVCYTVEKSVSCACVDRFG